MSGPPSLQYSSSQSRPRQNPKRMCAWYRACAPAGHGTAECSLLVGNAHLHRVSFKSPKHGWGHRPPPPGSTAKQGWWCDHPGGHSSKGRKRTKWLQLPIPQEAAPPQPHSHKASSFQELYLLSKSYLMSTRCHNYKKNCARCNQSQCKQSNGTPVIKKVIQITPKSN